MRLPGEILGRLAQDVPLGGQLGLLDREFGVSPKRVTRQRRFPSGWYLALNAARLPERKEDAIDRYAAGLRRRGIGTAPWFDQQLALALLGITATFAWEKALGGDTELRW